GHRINNKLHSLSGGEQQRVAIAISLANNPSLILADEPTGSVDTKTADIILDVLRNLDRELGVTIVIVTHDTQLTRKMDRVVAIRDGKTSSEILRRSAYLDMELEEEQGEDDDTHVELTVLDSARRIQVPEDYLEAIGVKDSNKVRMEIEDGKIIILNPNEAKKKVKVYQSPPLCLKLLIFECKRVYVYNVFN